MKITINKFNNEEYIKSLNESLDRFIAYAEKFGTKEIEFKGEMHIVPDKFGKHLDLALHLKDNLDNICLHVHNSCYDSNLIGDNVYPGKMLECLNNYRYFCYGNKVDNPHINFESLENQNNNTKNYVHYNFSVKKIKTLKDIA